MPLEVFDETLLTVEQRTTFRPFTIASQTPLAMRISVL